MSLNEETIEMMSAIRKEDPERWESKDIDLLEEATHRLEESQRNASVIEKQGSEKHRTPDEQQSQLTTNKYQKDKSQQWWRWLLFIPVGLIVLALGSFFVDILDYFETRQLPTVYPIVQFVSRSIPMIMAIAISVAVSSHLAPNSRIGGIIYCSMLLIFYGGLLLMLIIGNIISHSENITWVSYATLGLDIVTVIGMMIYITNNDID
jgi:hypothetical protein